MGKLFTEENIKGVNSDTFNTMTQSLLQSVSNVFNANTNSVEKSKSVSKFFMKKFIQIKFLVLKKIILKKI